MSHTDTSEAGLEAIITKSLVNEAKYVLGNPHDFDREHSVDLQQLLRFLAATQPKVLEQLGISEDGPSRTQFLHRLQGEIGKRGVIDVLRKGIKHGPATVELFFGTPTPGNKTAEENYKANVFSVTRQLRYSKVESANALDMAIFINGLPVITFELKNQLTKQTVEDAVQQYKKDRDAKEPLFHFGRCMVHFAVDDVRVKMCTHLKNGASWFLPFDKGWNDGAGNPPNPNGIETDYLWKEVLTRDSLTNIIENFAQVVEEKDEKTGRKKRKQVFPRYHQLRVVRGLLKEAAKGPGGRYLIQHSAGSGKSNSITWLAHQLVEVQKDGKPVFDSVIVVTDRRVLDKQIRDNIKQFAQVAAIVGAVTQGSGQLRSFLREGKKIIITTVQKFPFILDEIGDEHRGHKFAIVIDEAHSSQGSRTSAKMNIALSEQSAEDDETVEDEINRIIESRKMLPNASYFAFTATPKNKTLEVFGIKQPDGTFRPFHSYTMKQAIQEGFIEDVLANYTPVDSYYRLAKTIEDDPEFDAKKAQRKLRKYVESHDHAIRTKAEIMIDHFHESVAGAKKIGGRARAMIVCSTIERAMQYKTAFDAYLEERKSPFKSIVAFSGSHEYQGKKDVTEATMNGFPSTKIVDYFDAEEIKGIQARDPYRFLIVADKYQTGFDQPLLHTMYVDKVLSGVKAVQTLSRLNRAHPQKKDTFVLDFMNDTESIQKSFEPYYRTTVLSEATDPNKLHDLKADLDGHQVYSQEDVETIVERFLSGASRETLDPILDVCVATYIENLDEGAQVDFKGKAKTFVRTYNFLAGVLEFANPTWEKLSIFLNFLIPKLPAPVEEDLSKGVLETIDMDSYRAEVKAKTSIKLVDDEGEIDPVPTGGGGGRPEPEIERLSVIVKQFNEQWGNIPWEDKDRIIRVITEELPEKVNADEAYSNAKANSDKQNARIEHDKALGRAILELMTDHTELFKQFTDNPGFKKSLSDAIFALTYKEGA
ncbi:type I restriction endonuclease subunit R [Planctomicrobium sp. SH661]|uniref:type I restriction endonuclease subunit R n=1 Tax=Planctomicrobium sp. SH661 TaxID=3448124 RepID=UPI003F5B46BF